MNKEIKNIIPNVGLGILKFGMSKDEIVELIGQPNEKEKIVDDQFPDEETEAWHYDELEISLGFEDIEGWKLLNIALSSNAYEFHNKKLVGLDRQALLAALDQIGLTEFLLEEITLEDEEQALIRSNETGVNFFLDDGILSEIMWSPIVNSEENHIFPN